jgi:hypothetical protein
MCFVAGIRDYFLIRDKELLIGIFSFICTVWLLTSVLSGTGVLHRGIPEYGESYTLQANPVPKTTEGDDPASADEPGNNSGTRVHIAEEHSRVKNLFNRFFVVTLAGGFIIGFLAVLAGGCVLRQHVLCAQGQRNSLFFIAGFYFASIVFYTLLFPYFQWVYG